MKYHKLPFSLLPLHRQECQCFLCAQGKSVIPFSGWTFPWGWHTFPMATGPLSIPHPHVQHGSALPELSPQRHSPALTTAGLHEIISHFQMDFTSEEKHWTPCSTKEQPLSLENKCSRSTSAMKSLPRAEEEIHSQGSCVLGSLLNQHRGKPSISWLCWWTEADHFSFCQKPPGLSGMRAAGQVSVEAERNHQVSREDGRERRRGITVVEKREGVGREKCYKSTMTTEEGDGKVSPFQ